MSHRRRARAVLSGGGLTYAQTLLGIQSANLKALWKLSETSGTAIVDSKGAIPDGVYTAVTLNATTFKNGDPAPSWDGSTSYGNVFDAALASVFNGQLGTLMIWCKMFDAAQWGAGGNLKHLFRFNVDGNNVVAIRRANGVDNSMVYLYIAGSTTDTVTFDTGGTLEWAQYALTWNKAQDRLRAYFNGSQAGSTQTGLGTFAGDITVALLGAQATTPTNVLSGYLAYAALWDEELTAAQVAAAYF